MIADINDSAVCKMALEDDELRKIRQEAYNMAQDKEVQNMLMQKNLNGWIGLVMEVTEKKKVEMKA